MRTALALLALGLALNGTAIAGDVKAGKVKYDQLCLTCHGATGSGDGPAAGALNPKPRSFTDAAWQANASDDHIRTVTTKGGMAVGLSPIMPALGAGLSPTDLDNLIAYIRSLAK
jgi:mono/diheme cytochrome c family protein